MFSVDFQIKKLKFNARLCLTLILFFGLLCFLIDRYIGSFALNENRISAFITLIVPISLFCLVIEKLIASSSILVALLLRSLPIFGFSVLLILFPEEYGLMFTTLLIYILYFVVFISQCKQQCWNSRLACMNILIVNVFKVFVRK